MTPYELIIHIEEYNRKAEFDNEERITLAYLGANLQRAKRMPELKKLIGKKEKPKATTDESMLAEIKKMHAAMDGTTS